MMFQHFLHYNFLSGFSVGCIADLIHNIPSSFLYTLCALAYVKGR